MQAATIHFLLVRAPTLEQAVGQVRRFMDSTQLVSYAEYVVNEADVLSGTNPRFLSTVEEAVAANHRFTERLLADLSRGGVSRLEDLATLKQGYLSKTLHVLAHVLDGFIGTDSRLYSLVEDSHWISPQLVEEMADTPEQFWLVPVDSGEVTTTLLNF